MTDWNKYASALSALCAVVALSGCTTTETVTKTRVSSAATATTGSAAASISSESTTVARSTVQPPPPPQTADVLKDANKPCGTVAVDAPKFVSPETTE